VNAFIELATNRGIGFNYVISSGNEAVLNTQHYLDWLADDPETKVIVSVIEGVKDGARFRAALERATRRKPVVVLKLGRSEAGRVAVMAHTGSLAGSDETFKALCIQCGAVLVDTVDAALETAAMLLKVPLPKGDRMVIFSGSGGATTLATDIASGLGLKFLPLTASTNARMQQIFEVPKPFINPFDVGAYPLLARGNNMKDCLETLVADETVDLIGCVLIVQRDLLPIHKRVFDQMAAVVPNTSKPIVLIAEMASHWRDLPSDLGVYTTASLQEGLVALRGLADYAAYRRRLPAETKAGNVRRTAVPAPTDGRVALTEFESKRVLAEAGLPITREELVKTADEAVAAATRIGFPVALKVQSPDLMHKTDVGALALDLKNGAEVRAAFERLFENVTERAVGRPRIDGLLVQEMVADGVEFLLGMHRDPALGPVVVLSPGGVFVELFENSAALRLPPFGADVAQSMIRDAVAAERLLGGFRGRPTADRAALARLVCDFAAFVAGVGEQVKAIDLNPVMVLPAGRGVRIVDAAIEIAG
jgi:acetyltransferase